MITGSVVISVRRRRLPFFDDRSGGARFTATRTLSYVPVSRARVGNRQPRLPSDSCTLCRHRRGRSRRSGSTLLSDFLRSRLEENRSIRFSLWRTTCPSSSSWYLYPRPRLLRTLPTPSLPRCFVGLGCPSRSFRIAIQSLRPRSGVHFTIDLGSS